MQDELTCCVLCEGPVDFVGVVTFPEPAKTLFGLMHDECFEYGVCEPCKYSMGEDPLMEAIQYKIAESLGEESVWN